MSEAYDLDGFVVPGFDGAKWQKASRSNQQHLDDCIALSQLSDGAIGIADTKNPGSGAHTFSRSEFAAFVDGVRAGEFDHLI